MHIHACALKKRHLYLYPRVCTCGQHNSQDCSCVCTPELHPKLHSELMRSYDWTLKASGARSPV